MGKLEMKWAVIVQKDSGWFETITSKTNRNEYINRKFEEAWLSPETPVEVQEIFVKNTRNCWQTENAICSFQKRKIKGLLPKMT